VQDLPHDQERLFLTFPMRKEPEILAPAWHIALAAIGERLAQGRNVAFVTEGDPTLFSTFIYLQRAAPQLWPEVEVEVVPAVSSVMAVAAASGVPLADGQERIAILPGTCGVDDLEDVLARFDTVVLMKMGPAIGEIVATLQSRGLLDKAVYVSKATMRDERIVRDVRDVREGRGDCFAMMLVARRERHGVLLGHALPGPLPALLPKQPMEPTHA
jgi:precorrin-2/cobalt-factor-2 C20-methyltransferase